MKRLLSVLALVAFCAVSGNAGAEEKSVPAAPTLAVPAGVKIMPHRAVYKMALGKIKNGSAISSVTGTMLFDWGDACDGWAIQQHMKLHFIYAEGDQSDVESSVVTWEAKDGSKYNYNIRRQTNGEVDDVFRGRATLSPKGGEAVYAVPKDKKKMELSNEMLFPSAHTMMIIEKALAGEKMFTKPVFDGSDDAGSAFVSAFIGGKMATPQQTEMNPDLAKSPLLASPAWPVRLAFYAPDDQTGQPDYEMDLVLQANGVARSMTIDYGEFAVAGVLTNIEPASDVSCPVAP